MHDVKSLSWRTLFAKRSGVWRARFNGLAITSEVQFQTKLNYIHNNPVKAGLANEAESWPFSSASCWKEGVSDSLTTLESPY